MLVNCQRYLRNTYYKKIHRSSNAYAVLFDYLYHIHSDVFPWIHIIDNQRSIFISVDFLSPQLQPYKGLEIAVFSPYLVSCYWLPGAKTQANGFVEAGEYHVSLKILNESRLTYIHLQKVNESMLQISHIYRCPMGEKTTYLPCNLLHYRLFQSELESLICHGLEALHHKKNDINHQEYLNEIRKKSVGLSDDIIEKVKQLQSQ